MEKTHCLFQALLRPGERDYYSNPLYEPTELAIWPSVHPQSLQLWRGKLWLARPCWLPLTMLMGHLRLLLTQAHVRSQGFFLRWTQQARHLEEAQEEIRNMVIEWGRLALSWCPVGTRTSEDGQPEHVEHVCYQCAIPFDYGIVISDVLTTDCVLMYSILLFFS